MGNKSERLALFIDGVNTYAAAKSLGFEIDYKRLHREFSARGRLIRAYYYTAIWENDGNSPIRPMIDWLDFNGFTVVTKPAREFSDSTGHISIKNNMDVDLTVNAIELAPYVDQVFIFSGNGNLRPLIDHFHRKSVNVCVVSTLRTQQSMISDDLRRHCDSFIELDDLRGAIGREYRHVAPIRG